MELLSSMRMCQRCRHFNQYSMLRYSIIISILKHAQRELNVLCIRLSFLHASSYIFFSLTHILNTILNHNPPSIFMCCKVSSNFVPQNRIKLIFLATFLIFLTTTDSNLFRNVADKILFKQFKCTLKLILNYQFQAGIKYIKKLFYINDYKSSG